MASGERVLVISSTMILSSPVLVLLMVLAKHPACGVSPVGLATGMSSAIGWEEEVLMLENANALHMKFAVGWFIPAKPLTVSAVLVSLSSNSEVAPKVSAMIAEPPPERTISLISNIFFFFGA